MTEIYIQKRPKELTVDLVLQELGKKFISNSQLSRVKNKLLGKSMPSSNELYMRFGNELHKRILEPHLHPEVFDEDTEVILSGMCKSADSNSLLRKHMRNSKNEDKIIRGGLGGILDIHDDHDLSYKVGMDLKTTSCKTEGSFISAAKNYGYFRQGEFYKRLADLDKFYFVGISKKKPYNVFILDCDDYPEHMKSAGEEIDFLLYIMKNYIL